MQIPLFQVDAFTSQMFGGNPAAVCPLETWLPDQTMQRIAAENNLAETAFFTGQNGGMGIRWFTPEREVDLCGHATLASAYILFNVLEQGRSEVTFQSRSGRLTVTADGDGRLTLDFPSRPPAAPVDTGLLTASLGGTPTELYDGAYLLAVFPAEEQVRALAPDFPALARVGQGCVIVTAPGGDCDFVSRFFAPAYGIDEDPVTGSAHCTLTPYWKERLGKSSLFARQISKRGGELWCTQRDDRVLITGEAVLYLRGSITI